MAVINPDEISSILKENIRNYEAKAEVSNIGSVLEVGDGIARIYGLRNVMSNELVEFEDGKGTLGITLNLEEDNVGVVILGEYVHIKEGMTVKTTGRIASVPVGDALIGRIVNPTGKPIDGKGDIITDKVNTGALRSLLDMGAVPVFCALSYDGNGTLLNSNADGVASALAVAMSARQEVDLVYCFELPGVMRDISDSESWIPEINEDSYARLREEGIVQKGMIPKIDNAFAALRQGVRCVVIKSSADIAAKRGTIIRIH